MVSLVIDGATLVFFAVAAVALLNPKTSLFFVAFVPRFVDALQGSATSQVLLLGSIFVVLGICTKTAYAMLAGAAGRWPRRNRAVARH